VRILTISQQVGWIFDSLAQLQLISEDPYYFMGLKKRKNKLPEVVQESADDFDFDPVDKSKMRKSQTRPQLEIKVAPNTKRLDQNRFEKFEQNYIVKIQMKAERDARQIMKKLQKRHVLATHMRESKRIERVSASLYYNLV